MQIDNDKIKAILERYNNGDTALFNWCDEYNQWVNSEVSCNVTSEWEYILKKSYEDSDTPFSYDDYEMYYYDEDELIKAIMTELESEYTDKAEVQDFKEEILSNFDGTFEEYLEGLYADDLKEMIEQEPILNNINVEDYERTTEIFQWFIVGSDFEYRLNEVDSEQVFLNGAWGRQCCGQSISLDYCVRQAFITKLKAQVV